ncbi:MULTISPECIES: hypothetical protein [Tsukamurella]|uniref:Secreted protein n=2 Tax=Tsukamurella TaxID=2060 RepID=A0A5C5S0Q0_9ACTN|nr:MULTISPECIES: hypothetical protein [Tsukamurella]NMD54216.1 hypothetical protein [Tsukamurella columbiensis]TWS28260.1 hypothetical protein FK530_14390 [Tsukamurella conjunctivitidis]
MNPRWFALGALALALVAGCSTSDDSGTASPVSFAAASAAAVERATAAPASDEVPRAAAGTVCGSLDLPRGSAAVVVREGRVNCVDALRVGRVYLSAAAQSEGRAVTVQTSGWTCLARVTDSVGTCRADGDAFSVG